MFAPLGTERISRKTHCGGARLRHRSVNFGNPSAPDFLSPLSREAAYCQVGRINSSIGDCFFARKSQQITFLVLLASP
jgi:hypothetical protein